MRVQINPKAKPLPGKFLEQLLEGKTFHTNKGVIQTQIQGDKETLPEQYPSPAHTYKGKMALLFARLRFILRDLLS